MALRAGQLDRDRGCGAGDRMCGCSKKEVELEAALAAALYRRDWHCGRGLLCLGRAMRSVTGAGARARWLAVALEGKPGQRHRHSASLTKGRGGIG